MHCTAATSPLACTYYRYPSTIHIFTPTRLHHIFGRALNGKGDESSWNSAPEQLRKSIGKNIRGVEKDVFKLLEWSYNYLESEEAKKCFLLCSLFPEDSNIPIEDIVRYGIGLDLFESIDNMGQARDRVHGYVGILKKCYLLLDSEREECVKIHDVIRDVAISIASREENSFMIRCNEELKDWPENDRHQNNAVISMRCIGMPNNLVFPKLQLLRIQSNIDIFQEFPKSYFEGMKELKVVALLEMYIPSLPASLRCLTNLRTLSLFFCRLTEIDLSIIGALENLKILSFVGLKIHELPEEMGTTLSTGIASFPFPGQQVATLQVQAEKQKGWQDHQFSERVNLFLEQQQQLQKGSQHSFAVPEQFQGQILWEDRFFV
ncbi:hypothetical protein Acr_11g0004370 [Actinidia rufa]|uniref:Disease resistance protein n=1 Tax=Actinidia rufa TaxID=165716 RepID=A0A7J0FBS5_9ERIC|nr:hypothetical protein Acr_11g0004370 [Actinidia rufa]